MSAQKKTSKTAKVSEGFSAAEKAAMKERARELKALERIGKDRAKGEEALLEVVNKLPDTERKMCARLHTLISSAAPALLPRTWYGMPAYANEDGKVVLFFQPGSKFETRYTTLGFNDSAMLDDGNMWPASFALVKLSAAEEAKITKLVKKAIG